MEKRKVRNWWFMSLNGLISILFGLLLLLFQKETLQLVVMYFGILIFIIGLGLLVVAIRNLKQDRSVLMIFFESVLSLTVGFILIIFPKSSIYILTTLIGIWAIIVGIIHLYMILKLNTLLSKKILPVINGLLSIGFGTVMLFNPIEWARLLVSLLGILSVAIGLLMIWFSFILRSIKVKEVPVDQDVKQ
jgi:uncharacterized membrane protein HdeD (DUF308 family)